MESTDYLVIILSIGMSIMLILNIIALVIFIRILRTVRTITTKAEHIAGNVDAVSEFFKKTAGPVAIGKLIANLVEAMKHHKQSK